MKSRGSSDKRSLKCLMRGWLTTPPGCSSPWRWPQFRDAQGPQGRMALQAGQALRGHPDSLARSAGKDGRACQECEDCPGPKVKRGTLVSALQEKMVSPGPQVPKALPAMVRWVPLDRWASKAFLASLAPRVPWGSPERPATATPPTALGPCPWSSSTHP